MAKFLGIALLSSYWLLALCTPLRRVHHRQLSPVIQISLVDPPVPTTMTGAETPVEGSMLSQTSNLLATTPTPFLWEPSLLPPPSVQLPSVSISTTVEIVSETFTTTVYEEPKIVTVTAAPTTITNTITVSEPFTATPGSFWSAPARFSNLDSFKIAHFATGEKNLQITNGVPLDEIDNSLANLLGSSTDMEELYGPGDTWNSSSALQIYYPEDSINPGNSPQGGADFYGTPLPLADAENVTLAYSVFFPKEFDWVRGGKLPGLYGGHMTCSGGDDATSCFSTRLMWREGGAGELYLYAPKDKQTSSLCHAPPESVCNDAYGLSVGRGSFNFTPGEWTNVKQTVSLNTPGKHDGGFRLEVNGKQVMDRHDVFYRDAPSKAESSPSTTQTGNDDDADDGNGGGLLSPLLGGVLKDVDKAGVDRGVLPPIANSNNTSLTTSLQYPLGDRPPLLTMETFSQLPATGDAASALIYSLTASRSGMPLTTIAVPTLTQIDPQPTVTITNYLWKHAFTAGGNEKSVLGIGDDRGEPKPIGFSGLFFSTFFGGSSEEYATPKDQYTWFRDFSMTINS